MYEQATSRLVRVKFRTRMYLSSRLEVVGLSDLGNLDKNDYVRIGVNRVNVSEGIRGVVTGLPRCPVTICMVRAYDHQFPIR